jgi:DNA invertase Pin-like site-specific DNA recombinase
MYKKNLWIYTRVSTPKQQNSLITQEKLIKERLFKETVYQDYNLKETVSDIGSGGKMQELKNLQQLTHNCNIGDLIAIKNVSRFTRNLDGAINILNFLNNKHVHIYSVLEKIYSSELQFYDKIRAAELELKAYKQRAAFNNKKFNSK